MKMKALESLTTYLILGIVIQALNFMKYPLVITIYTLCLKIEEEWY